MESINIEDRKKISIKGATKIVSAVGNQAVVEISNTNLIIGGNNLEVVKLDLDNQEVVFSGEIMSLKYTKKAEKTNIFKKIFK